VKADPLRTVVDVAGVEGAKGKSPAILRGFSLPPIPGSPAGQRARPASLAYPG
jgi:hypothetical protein